MSVQFDHGSDPSTLRMMKRSNLYTIQGKSFFKLETCRAIKEVFMYVHDVEEIYPAISIPLATMTYFLLNYKFNGDPANILSPANK